MKQSVCTICGYVYEETQGSRWEDLPEDWKCPICRAGKEAFRLNGQPPEPAAALAKPHVEQELSPMEMSVICSNLARGCEKQYLPEQAEDFRTLAEFFKSKAEPEQQPGTERLLTLIEKDLAEGYPYANAVAGTQHDRGALRALVWSEKVTRMLQSLMTRYQQEGPQMLEHTGVYVCTVCGFVYVGSAPPELCPVCKVPAWKFEKAEGRTGK